MIGTRKLVVTCTCGLPKYLRRVQGRYCYMHKSKQHRLMHDRIMLARERQNGGGAV